MKKLIKWCFVLTTIVVVFELTSCQPQVTDITPPTDVTNLAVVAKDGRILLVWTDAPDNDVFGYEVGYNGTSAINRAALPSMAVKTMMVAQGAGGCYVSNLTNGTQYTFTVKTIDTSWNKSNGKTITATPVAASTGEEEQPHESAEFHESVAYLASGTDGTAGTSEQYVLFGDWPQSIKPAGVIVDESNSKQVGMFTYYLGSDYNWYVKQQEKANSSSYKYSTGAIALKSSNNSYKYFKVEPIKWRVVTTNFNRTGKKLLLAENILINCAYYDGNNRTIDDNTISGCNYEHSRVRAFLNGLSYNKSGSTNYEFSGNGFLQTAFTTSAQGEIPMTAIDNSSISNTDAGNNITSPFVSADTVDKVFLLSEREATTYTYKFAEYNKSGEGNTRIRKPTDFAIANGTYKHLSNNYVGGYWWLRSPYSDIWSNVACRVGYAGTADGSPYYSVSDADPGVVPALCIK